MSLSYSVEQEEFRRVLRAFLAAKSPESAVRQTMLDERGYDPDVWTQLSGQLGIPGLAIAEEFGGAGYSFMESAVVLHEAGRALLCAPLLSSVLAASALTIGGDEAAQRQWLPGIASGSTLATVALQEAENGWNAATLSTTATVVDGVWLLNGTKPYVLDGHIATLILAAARTPQGPALFAVDATQPRLTATALETLDQTRRFARIELRDVPARPIGDIAAGAALLDELAHIATAALACEQAGIAERILEMAVEYAGQRVQFGRVIGSFQAIKHKCADLLAGVESAKTAAFMAAGAVAQRSAELPELAAIAGSYCSEVCMAAAHENIQIHGAIAFTWEYPAQLYYKRAKSDEVLFGDVTYHRENLARAIGL